MAIVTDLEFALENRLIKKLDLIIDRCTKPKPIRDSWIICEGGEGEGKTNASLAIAYYAKYKTGRDIHLFFRMQPMMDFAKRTEKKIIILDEPSLDSLKGDGNNALNRDFKRFMATCRKKQHLVITNLTRFYIFSEYLVIDRCLGLIHMYSRKEIEPGRFVYVKKSKLESLYRAWNSKGLREYRQNKSFGGSFPEIMERHFDKMDVTIEGKQHCTLKDYGLLKDKGIEAIGEKSQVLGKKDLKQQEEIRRLKFHIANIARRHNIPNAEIANQLQISIRNLQIWAKYDPNPPNSLGNQGFESDDGTQLITIGGNQEKISAKQGIEQQEEPSIIN